jgi:hypothetical protein
MAMIVVATPLVVGSLIVGVAHALCATLALCILIHRIRAIHHTTEVMVIDMAAVAAIIIIDTADFTSHLVDDGAN